MKNNLIGPYDITKIIEELKDFVGHPLYSVEEKLAILGALSHHYSKLRTSPYPGEIEELLETICDEHIKSLYTKDTQEEEPVDDGS